MSDRLAHTLLWIGAVWVLVDALIIVIFFWPAPEQPDIGEPPRDPSDPRTITRGD